LEAQGKRDAAVEAFQAALRANGQNAEAAAGLKRLGVGPGAAATAGTGGR
jgi:hypothetical protein